MTQEPFYVTVISAYVLSFTLHVRTSTDSCYMVKSIVLLC